MNLHVISCLRRISLSNLTHMISIVILVAIIVDTRIDSRYSLEKGFIKLISINLLIVSYQTTNQVD